MKRLRDKVILVGRPTALGLALACGLGTSALAAPPMPSNNVRLGDICTALFSVERPMTNLKYTLASEVLAGQTQRHTLTMPGFGQVVLEASPMTTTQCAAAGLPIDQLTSHKQGDVVAGKTCLSTDKPGQLLAIDLKQSLGVAAGGSDRSHGVAAIQYCSTLDEEGNFLEAKTVRYGAKILAHVG